MDSKIVDIKETYKISKVAVSPNGKYVVTYSEGVNRNLIVGWNIDTKEDLEGDSNYFENEESLAEIEEEKDLNYSKRVEIDIKDEEDFNSSKKEDSKSSHPLVIEEDPLVAKNDFPLLMHKKVSKMRVSDNKMVALYCGDPHIKLYKLGDEKHIKIDFKHSNGDIRFALDGKRLVYYKLNRILIYSLDIKINKLKLESIYRVHFDGAINECGITNNTIWARSPHHLHLWNLHTLQNSPHRWNFLDGHLPERNYYLASIDSSQSISLKTNNNLILTIDNGQNVIFSREFNTPIRHFKDENFERLILTNDYLLVQSAKSAKNQILLHNIFDENKQPLELHFKRIEQIYDYNLQANKIYGVNNNEIVTYDLNKYNLEKHFKSEESGWHYYLDDDIDINDTIIDPDMENIRNLLEKKNGIDKSVILFHNLLYGWEICSEKYSSSFKIKIIKINPNSNSNSSYSYICSKDIYEPIKCTLLKNNALALILVKNERKLLTIFKFYKNNIQLQYFTYIKDYVQNENTKSKDDEGTKNYTFNSSKDDEDTKSNTFNSSKDDQDTIKNDTFNRFEIKIFNIIKKIERKFWPRKEDEQLESESLPLGDIDFIIENEKDHLEKEWLKFVTDDYFTLLKYGSEYFKIFIKYKNNQLLVNNTYNKCIDLVKKDSEKNLNFLDIINSSIRELILTYPEYLNKFNHDMFILLNPTKNELIDSNYHVNSDRQTIRCLRLPLCYDQSVYLTCAYNSLCCYPSKYSWVKELFYKPQSSIFIKTCQKGFYNKIYEEEKNFKMIKNISIKIDNIEDLFNLLFVPISIYKFLLKEISGSNDQIIYHNNSHEDDLDRRKDFYNNLNGEAIVDFKWKAFGKYYYFLIWFIFTIFQISFIIGSLSLSFKTNNIQTILYKITLIIGFVQLYFELRQFIWDPIEYIHSIWNLFDLAAFLFPIITSYFWVYNHDVIPNWAISLSCLFLNIKFLLFFRAFESFGIYFAIIFGVIRRVFSFLVILVIIIASFALSFHLLLVDVPSNNDNPNLFTSFQNSLLATYLFASDTGSITSLATSTNNTIIIVLMILFSFLIVIYLMNLFIGLLNTSIERDNDRASYLVQKAEILAEIELFYLLPFQRRWKHWFPEVIHYKVRRDITRKYVSEAIKNGKWKSDEKYREKVLRQIDMLDLINSNLK
ncbi:hypothetical protein RclHR1_00980011 [Rhizophagus clarus]|uniref:Ion transport domain-containing protein n=1 Tax=Rhizophagus clarus TaxID=94130 RepID=A0A2Z6S5I8_9GLOM|nr:hypothetical protein RclHR1_00980011 [Rhizophagus clarus]GES81158.1 hypothetical protein GLOIN_2v1766079 [Rhizophagus clarus]